jgi:hypothetical protein
MIGKWHFMLIDVDTVNYYYTTKNNHVVEVKPT